MQAGCGMMPGHIVGVGAPGVGLGAGAGVCWIGGSGVVFLFLFRLYFSSLCFFLFELLIGNVITDPWVGRC